MKDNKKMIDYIFNWILPIAAVLVILSIAANLIGRNVSQMGENIENVFEGEEGKVNTISESELEKIVKQSDLYLVEYPHNGCVEVKDEKGNTEYYVAYKGSVKAGIDFSKIEYSIDKETNVINIKLPEIMLDDPVVDVGSIDYIFINEKRETESIAQEAYEYAYQDLKCQLQNDEQLKTTAMESAKATEKALIEPWLDLYDGMQYEINVSNGQ